MTTCVTLLAANFSQAQVATPGAWVPGYGETMPYYFTGTNSVAKGTVCCPGYVGIDQNYFVDADLKIGGTIVRHYQWPIGKPKQTLVTLSAVFDSTHFPHGTSLTVEIVGHTNLGQTWQASNSTIVTNVLSGFNYPEFWPPLANGLNEVVDQMASQNYDFQTWYENWARIEIGIALLNSSIYYVNSHGLKGNHYTAYTNWLKFDPNNDESHYYADISLNPNYLSPEHNYEYTRAIGNGFGLPPLISTAVPDVHFAQFDSCESGCHFRAPEYDDNCFGAIGIDPESGEPLSFDLLKAGSAQDNRQLQPLTQARGTRPNGDSDPESGLGSSVSIVTLLVALLGVTIFFLRRTQKTD